MNNSTNFDIVSLVGIKYSDDGNSIYFEIVETIPPHASKTLIFENILLVKLCQTPGSCFPMTLCEMTWNEVLPPHANSIFSKLGYPFHDENGNFLLSDNKMIQAHIEGDVVGDIIAESIQIV